LPWFSVFIFSPFEAAIGVASKEGVAQKERRRQEESVASKEGVAKKEGVAQKERRRQEESVESIAKKKTSPRWKASPQHKVPLRNMTEEKRAIYEVYAKVKRHYGNMV